MKRLVLVSLALFGLVRASALQHEYAWAFGGKQQLLAKAEGASVADEIIDDSGDVLIDDSASDAAPVPATSDSSPAPVADAPVDDTSEEILDESGTVNATSAPTTTTPVVASSPASAPAPDDTGEEIVDASGDSSAPIPAPVADDTSEEILDESGTVNATSAPTTTPVLASSPASAPGPDDTGEEIVDDSGDGSAPAVQGTVAKDIATELAVTDKVSYERRLAFAEGKATAWAAVSSPDDIKAIVRYADWLVSFKPYADAGQIARARAVVAKIQNIPAFSASSAALQANMASLQQ